MKQSYDLARATSNSIFSNQLLSRKTRRTSFSKIHASKFLSFSNNETVNDETRRNYRDVKSRLPGTILDPIDLPNHVRSTSIAISATKSTCSLQILKNAILKNARCRVGGFSAASVQRAKISIAVSLVAQWTCHESATIHPLGIAGKSLDVLLGFARDFPRDRRGGRKREKRVRFEAWQRG